MADKEREPGVDLTACYEATEGPWYAVGRLLYAGRDMVLIGVLDRPEDVALAVLARQTLAYWITKDLQNARDFVNFGRCCALEVEALKARIKALEDALAPFAAVGDLAASIGMSDYQNVARMPMDTAPLVRECIQARDVLREGKTSG